MAAFPRIYRSFTEFERDELRKLGYGVPPSIGNFILVRFRAGEGRDALAADAFLKSRGFIARRMGAYKLPDSLRVTIGLEDEMRAFVEALADFADAG